MGAKGPLPMRSEEKVGRPHGPAFESVPEQVEASGEVTVPPPHPDWHGLAKCIYQSLQESPVKRFYESTDWYQAQLACHVLSVELRKADDGKAMNSQIMAQVDSIFARLLTTEADRRRNRLEIQRQNHEKTKRASGSVSSMADRRAQMSKPRVVKGGA